MAELFTKVRNYIYPFWIINLFGWGILCLIKLFLYYYMDLSDPQVIYAFLLTYITGFFCSGLLRSIYHKIKDYSKSIVKLAIRIVTNSLAMTLIWFSVDFVVSIPINGLKEMIEWYTPHTLFVSLWNLYYILILWSTFYFVIRFWLESKAQRETAEKAVLLAQSAQLQMLRYQVNPHFLFNSLSSLRALIRDNQKKAEEMILQISKFLRYSLISKKNNQVFLKEEVAALGHYFEIERVRFGNKLVTEINIDKQAEDILIPSFLIHPLIENAIKYGMDTSTMPLKISLNANLINSQLQIEITNSGHWVNKNNHNVGTGTGLKNVKQRLELAFPNNHSFEIIKNKDLVSVKIFITVIDE